MPFDSTRFRGVRLKPVIERPCGDFAPFVKPPAA
jgi:hypothetical protein